MKYLIVPTIIAIAICFPLFSAVVAILFTVAYFAEKWYKKNSPRS